MLRPLNEFPDDPQTAQDWGIIDPEVFKIMQWSGKIDRLKEKLDLLKEKYKMSRTMDMPRGKRFLMYHETLIGWRNFIKKIRAGDQKNSLYLDYKKLLTSIKTTVSPQTPKSDKEIVQSIMTKYQNKF